MATVLAAPDAAPQPSPTRVTGRLLLGGPRAAVTAALAGLGACAVLIGLGWLSAGRPDVEPGAAARAVGLTWLTAHGSGVELPTGTVTLLPLGLVLLPAIPLYRAARRSVAALRPRRLGSAAVVVLGTAVPYAAIVSAVAAVTGSGRVVVSPARAGLGALALATAAAAAGTLRTGWPRAALGSRLPGRLWLVLRAGVAAVLTLVAGGALLVGFALVLDLHEAAELHRSVAPDPQGGAGLVLAQVLLVPNAVVWAIAVATGPGVALGAGTGSSVGLAGAGTGPFPAVPLLAALPAPGEFPWPALLAVVIPVAAGGVAGRLLRRGAVVTWWQAGQLGLAVGLVTGALLLLPCALSGGGLGDGRLQHVGPSPLSVALAGGLEVGLVAANAASLPRRRRR